MLAEAKLGGRRLSASFPAAAPPQSESRTSAGVADEPCCWVETAVEGVRWFPRATASLPDVEMPTTERLGKLGIVRRGTLLPGGMTGVPDAINSGMFDALSDVKLGAFK
jgi:hypothetical protein